MTSPNRSLYRVTGFCTENAPLYGAFSTQMPATLALMLRLMLACITAEQTLGRQVN